MLECSPVISPIAAFHFTRLSQIHSESVGHTEPYWTKTRVGCCRKPAAVVARGVLNPQNMMCFSFIIAHPASWQASRRIGNPSGSERDTLVDGRRRQRGGAFRVFRLGCCERSEGLGKDQILFLLFLENIIFNNLWEECLTQRLVKSFSTVTSKS